MHPPALVSAAVITVAVFPALALLLRAKSEGAQPKGVVAIAALRVADLAAAQYSRFIAFIFFDLIYRGDGGIKIEMAMAQRSLRPSE